MRPSMSCGVFELLRASKPVRSETLRQLEAKGETSKVYMLDRLQALKAAAAAHCLPRTRRLGLR